jgi:hypothetical protein
LLVGARPFEITLEAYILSQNRVKKRL